MEIKEILAGYPDMDQIYLEEALKTVLEQTARNREYFSDSFPAAASVENVYPKTANDDWTDGFHTGMMWLSYEETGDEKYREAAENQVESFLKRILDRVVVDHHDMGFLYSPSCVAAYRLTGNETGKKAALLAADNLLSRFQEKGSFFQAWGKLGEKENYRLIIDCLMNMPLLFWSSEVTGDEKYREHALCHIHTSMKYVIRDDFSTYHTFYFDPETGEPLKGVTQQGYRNGSIWARGQSWGIYGSAVSYEKTKDPAYIGIFRKVTECFLKNLPADLVPYWDFDFREGSKEPRDSSSAAIAACGMIEMAKYLPCEEGEIYRGLAGRLIRALTDHCLNQEKKPGMGILLHGTYAKASPYNGVQDGGVDECNLWGDYFYMEALVRLKRDWKLYW